MNFIISTATDIGTTKATNQDSFNARVVTTPLGRMAFAVVCDGMGGLDKGEVASASVVNAFCKWAEQRLPDLCESGLTDSAVRADWVGTPPSTTRRSSCTESGAALPVALAPR